MSKDTSLKACSEEESELKDGPRGTGGQTNGQYDADDTATSALPGVHFAFPNPTTLLSFTTTIPTILTSTMKYLYYDVLRVLLVTAPVTLLVAAISVIIAALCCYCCLLLLATKAAGPASGPPLLKLLALPYCAVNAYPSGRVDAYSPHFSTGEGHES